MEISTRLPTTRAWFSIQVSNCGRLDKTVNFIKQYQNHVSFIY